MSAYTRLLGCSLVVLLLSGCASAVFPDFDDNLDEMEVHEGGRVIRELPKEGNSLRADTENVAYEEDEELEADSLEPTKTTSVETEELEDELQDEPEVKEDEKEIEKEDKVEAENKISAEDVGESVSYRVDTFYFDNGSAYLSPKYNKNLRNIAKMIKENNARVIVYGHSSSRTRDTDPASHKLANFKASMERAQNVASALKRVGVPADKISVEAMSDSMPAYQEVMPEGERLNRRAEVYIVY